MPNAKIGDNVIIERAIIGTETIIDDNYSLINIDSIGVVGANKHLSWKNDLAIKEISLDLNEGKIKNFSVVGGIL